MALNYVTLTFTEQDAGQGAEAGQVTIVPTSAVVAAGVTVVSQDPVTRPFSAGTATATLVACDNAGTTPAAGYWAYKITLPGAPPGVYLVNFSNGSSQRFDNLPLAVASTTYGPPPGGGISLPLTTLGDTLYENATPTAARLPGNTTTTRQFLTQTGTGTVSAAPVWGAISASDMPVVTFTFGSTGAVPSSGTYTAGAAAIDQNGILRVCTVAGTPGTWARAGAQPHQFWVDDYGAKGDGKIGTGGTGTAGLNTFTDGTASFGTADTGKVILINQGAANSNTTPFTGTITVSSPGTSATLSANLGSNTASAPYIYGTDDATAISNCFTAAANYAAPAGGNAGNSPGKAQVIFSSKFYCVRGITQSSTDPAHYNCHIPLPYGPATGAKLMLEIVGAGMASAQSEYWESLFPQLMGSAIVSCYTPPSQPDATYGQFSMVQVPTGGSGQAGGFFNVLVVWNGITLCAPWNSFACGLDGIIAAQMSVPEGRAMSFTPVNLQAATVGGPTLNALAVSPPTNDVAVGFRYPKGQNNAFQYAGRVTTSGWSIGIQANEHFRGERLVLLYADRAFQIDATGEGSSHGYTIGHMTAENCNYIIYVANSSASTIFPFNAQLIDSESIWTGHVNDPNSCLSGTAYIVATTSGHLVNTGAQNLMCIDPYKFQPGPWSGAPAAPSSGTAQQNLSYHYATVYASASTSITNAAVGPTSGSMTNTGQTAGANSAIPVRVKPGWFYKVTYTGTLTTTWDLD